MTLQMVINSYTIDNLILNNLLIDGIVDDNKFIYNRQFDFKQLIDRGHCK